MKQSVEIEFDASVKAVLRGQDLSVSVAVSMPYGDLGRTVSVSEEISNNASFLELLARLEAIRDSVLPNLIKRAQAAAHQALETAVRNGEKV